MSAQRLTSGIAATLCALVGLLALWGAPARAGVTHEFLFGFSEVPASSGAAVPAPVTNLGAMTVDSGHVWITEQVEVDPYVQDSRVDEFDAATGGFVSQPLHGVYPAEEFFGIAVGHPTGATEPDFYVGEYDEGVPSVGVYSEAGLKLGTWTGADTPAKSFGIIFNLAVDDSESLSDWARGDVYVPVEEQKVVDVFQPEAGGKEKYVGQLPEPEPGGVAVPFKQPRNVAVDPSSGDVAVTDENVVDEFEPTVLGEYVFVRQLTGTPAGPFKNVGAVTMDGGETYVVAENSVVDQFGSAGVYRDQLTGTPAGPFQDAGESNVNSVAVDPASHDVYVGVRRRNQSTRVVEGVVDVFGPTVAIVDVAVAEPVLGLTPTSATLRGTVNPNEAGPATCEFEYGTSTSYGMFAECLGAGSRATPIAGGPGENSPVPVQSGVLEGLQSGTTYYYRLDGLKAGKQPVTGTCPEDCGQFTTPGPGIRSESVSDAASSSATLEATIDPHNAPTYYYFQYSAADTAACTPSSCASVPGSPAWLGQGEGDVEVSEHVQGLSAGATYHYRVVALGELKAGEEPTAFYGPDRTFTTQTASLFALPDGRRWELVSPPDKHGAVIEPLSGGTLNASGPLQAAEDGGGIVYQTNVPTEPEPPGYGALNSTDQVLSVRGANGWSTRDIATPHESATHYINLPEYMLFSTDLSSGLAEPLGEDETLLSPEASEPTPYLRHEALCDAPATASECYQPILTGKEGVADVPPGTEFGPAMGEPNRPKPTRVNFQGASPDLRHVTLSSITALTAAPIPHQGNEIYEFSVGAPASEALQLVSEMPASEGGGPAPTSSTRNTFVNVGVGQQYRGGSRNAVSSDGSRVFWELGTGAVAPASALYMRDTVKRETVRLDVPQPGAPAGTPTVAFQFASSDGSKVFFTDGQPLTSQSGTSSTDDLYRCDIVEEAGKLACKLTDLTPARSGISADVQNLLTAASEDGSYAYFVANGVLGEDKNSQGESATPGTCRHRVGESSPSNTCNLYEAHDGAIAFIATLSEGDSADWGGAAHEFQSVSNLAAYASPDGRYLTFTSQRSLTGYDNRDAVSGKPDAEVYLYDAVTGRLACVSCNPTGARPLGIEGGEFEELSARTKAHIENIATVQLDTAASSGVGLNLSVAANLPPGDVLAGGYADSFGESLYQPRVISDDGRVFFNSSDALVPQDVNENEDVYEFEPAGIGSCTVSSTTFSPGSGGCTSLISSGTSPEESGFLDASRGGEDVFFLTSSKLTSQDYDNSRDIYDAHVCASSSPCFNPPVSAPPCASSDACKGAPSPQPSSFGAPASATFSGQGNVVRRESNPVLRSTTLTRAQKLARALRACRKRPKRRRRACRRQASKLYGAAQAHRAGATRKARG